ncbi:hypothetical protein BDQ12DRAFT_737405 [Crucibulum laeve]|uniref:Uncharacterized protein n=1 Tax=Crucibulum laeve TaxID=68775 RepID=A0A5C3LTH7_9AGAR|nr:hypothetical protein BDQ12DRAFT_737405 [Crucibulum laeve]
MSIHQQRNFRWCKETHYPLATTQSLGLHLPCIVAILKASLITPKGPLSVSASRPQSPTSLTSVGLPVQPSNDRLYNHRPIVTFGLTVVQSSRFEQPPSFQQESGQQVLSALLTHPNLGTMFCRHNWTNYGYEPEDYEVGIRYCLCIVGPKLKKAKENVKFLELTLCREGLGYDWTGRDCASLTSTVTTTITFTALLTLSNLSRTLSSQTLKSIGSASPLVVPTLRSLKLTLDNATVHVLLTWET